MVCFMSVNPQEEELRRLTMLKAMTRREIKTTKDLSKKEVYRKRHEKISRELDDLLRYMKIQD